MLCMRGGISFQTLLLSVELCPDVKCTSFKAEPRVAPGDLVIQQLSFVSVNTTVIHLAPLEYCYFRLRVFPLLQEKNVDEKCQI